MMRFVAFLSFLFICTSTLAHDCELPIPECGITRTFNGECNNPVQHQWGAANSYLKRGAEGVWFADDVRAPVLTPNMRTVSNNLFRADDAKLQEDGLNLLWTFFGQFITHDLMGVHRRGDNGFDLQQPTNNSDVWLIVPLEQPDDALFTSIPRITVPYMRVLRSRGDMVNGVFQVGSDSTSYLDLDVVYGKEPEIAALLRKNSGGELKSRVYTNYTAVPATGAPPPSFGTTIPPSQVGEYGEWLPLIADVDPTRTLGIPISPQLVIATTQNIATRFFASGDGRNGENYALNIFQGLFLREHNRIARSAAVAHPSWSDEQVFQYARKINIAQYQAVVMYEFLPSLLESDYGQVGDYDGYDVFADATTTQLFAFAFRFGHTTVPNAYKLKNKCGGPAFNSSRDGPRSGQAAATFMPADQMAQVGRPENILHALLFEGARAVDTQFPESLRTIPGANVDITVQNQLRAADNGIPDYHTIRKLWRGGLFADIYTSPFCGATETTPSPDPIGCWLLITTNTSAATTLQSLYGKITKLNFYTAVVAEEPTRAVVGQTSARIIADQFKRSRDGDRWWFENEQNGLFTRAEARAIKRDSSIELLFERNFPNANVPEDAFYVPKPRFFRNCVP